MTRFALLPAVLTIAACAPLVPLPPEGSDIPWPDAVQLFQACQVESVYQAHDRTVSLTLTDGRMVHTITPRLDDVVREGVMPPRCDDVAGIME